MKKQMGVIVLALTLAGAAIAAPNIRSIDIETRMAKERISKAAFEGKTKQEILKESGTHINEFSKLVGQSPDIVAQNLARNPELLETYVYADMVTKTSDVSATDKQNAQNAKDILSNYGIAKGLKAEDMVDAKAEAPAVQKMTVLFSRLPAYGPKAVEMGRVFALEAKSGLSLNKALRSSAKRVLGLDGEALEKFMKDPKEGLGNCKI